MTAAARIDGLEISTDRDRLDRPMIHAFIAESYWGAGRTPAAIDTAIDASLCFGVYDPATAGRQVAFARVLTDGAFFAYLFDLFVVRDRRGEGIASGLTEAILAHPQVTSVRSILLSTRDAHGFYRRFGFEPLEAADRLMMRRGPTPGA